MRSIDAAQAHPPDRGSRRHLKIEREREREEGERGRKRGREGAVEKERAPLNFEIVPSSCPKIELDQQEKTGKKFLFLALFSCKRVCALFKAKTHRFDAEMQRLGNPIHG